MELRASLRPRYWHVGACALAAAAVFGMLDHSHLIRTGQLPALREYWWLVVSVPLLCGSLVALGSGGAALGRRIVSAAAGGALTGVLAALLSAVIGGPGQPLETHLIITRGVWQVFIFTIVSALGAAATELSLPEPQQAQE